MVRTKRGTHRTGVVVRDTRLDMAEDYIKEGTRVELLSGVVVDGSLLCRVSTRPRGFQAVAISETDIRLDPPA